MIDYYWDDEEEDDYCEYCDNSGEVYYFDFGWDVCDWCDRWDYWL